MKVVALVAVAGLALNGLGACGAGEPQTKASEDEAALALPEIRTTSDVARQEFIDGLHEFDMNRETAYEHFKRAAAADPAFAMAEAYAGVTAIAIAGRGLEVAAAHYNRAAELARAGTPAERLIVAAAQKGLEGDNEGALADALQLVKLEPNEARWWHDVVAFAYDPLNRIAEARAALAKAYEMAPGWAAPLINQSFMYAQREPRDLAKAEELARKATELAPNDPSPWDALGDALRAQGKLEEAAKAYTKCAELDPTRPEGLQQRGHVQSFLGRFSEARADYDAATPLSAPSRRVSFFIFRPFVSLHEGNPKAALAELEEMYASLDELNVPDPVGGRQQLLTFGILPIAFYHHMIPEAENAMARLAQLTEQQIQSVKSERFERTARANLAIAEGRLALAKGDYAGARRKAEQAITLRGGDRNAPDNRTARVLLGYVAHAQGNHQEAVREFERGDPNDNLMAYRQAQSLEALGRAAEARKLYEKIAGWYLNDVETAMLYRDAVAKSRKPAA